PPRSRWCPELVSWKSNIETSHKMSISYAMDYQLPPHPTKDGTDIGNIPLVNPYRLCLARSRCWLAAYCHWQPGTLRNVPAPCACRSDGRWTSPPRRAERRHRFRCWHLHRADHCRWPEPLYPDAFLHRPSPTSSSGRHLTGLATQRSMSDSRHPALLVLILN